MYTNAAAVTGARHLRAARNGQDAAAAWATAGAGAIVVCDGCGSGASSEVGARLGAQLVIGALAARLAAGSRVTELDLWAGVRAHVAAELGAIARAMPGDPDRVIGDYLLFTIVAAAVAHGEAAVWAIGDGAYALGDTYRALGPFDDNRPPYLAYDLLGGPCEAHVETAQVAPGTTIFVATDGVAELGPDAIDIDRALAHPDGLRRQLAVLARGTEAIDWDARRVQRTPARLQDDGAVAVLRVR